MPQVQVIQPIQQQPKRLRVAAYARVSSDSEDQLNSLAVQVDYYTHLIQENPNWEFAGIYTDEGITGTSTKHREQFNRLMDDCRAGLIDRVLVKSASRFARNTADALTSVRELKSLGVTVAFEKEGFDTETSNGEMLLSIICAVAQEESLSISQNMKWGIHKRMRTGNYITNATPFGYTQINHQLVPEKNNAMIVNDIFKSYLSGMGINEIAKHLNTIYPKENRKWNPRTIHAILRNEKYIGDSLYQKTYTTDSLPLKRYLNTGQRSKYYALETHEGIISKTDYEKVQNLLAKKSITGEIDRTCVFSKKIYCSICGAICSRKGPPTRGFVWCCRTHLQSKALCLLKSIREDELQQAFLSIYNRLQCNQKTILEPLVDDLLGLRHLQEQKYKNRLALGEDTCAAHATPMQQVTLRNTRVLFAAALPMNSHIVNKTRILIGAKVAPQFEKMIQKEYEQMQRMRYFDPHRSAYIPIQTLPDGRIQLAIRSTENNCRYNRRQAERMMNSPCDLVLYLNAYASPSNQGVRCRLVNFTILDGKEEKNLPRIGSWRSDDI